MTESILSIVSSARVAASGSVSPRTPAEDPRIAALRGSLEQARTQYTESHPDVARLKSLLAAAEKQGVTAVQEGPLKIDDPRERERITALESQLKITTDEIASLEADRARITRSLAAAQGRLERLPIREQQMAVVTRDYEIAKASYRSLLDKKFAAEMSTDMERRQKSERFTVLDAARPPGRSFRPDRWLWAGVSCAAGIGFGLLAGFLREAGGGTVLGQWELPIAAPILGRVPRVHGWVQKSRRISWLSRGGRRGTPARSPLGLCPLPDVGVQLGHSDGTPRSDAISLPDALDSPVSMVRPGAERALEEYRIIRTKILHHPLRPQTIVVSSPGPGDGKTTTALNVAAALAMKCQHDVLLVEADLRRPRLKSLLSLPERPGLADILNHSGSVEDAICKCRGLERLQLLPAGDAGSGAAELLDSDCWRNLCQKLRRTFRFILFDAPPIGPVADYDLVQVVSDGIIVVVRPDHTKRTALYDALAGVPEDKLIGIVLNDVPSYLFSKHHSYYGYNYSADQDEHRPAQLTYRAG